jgi:hypothetical protein
MTCPQCGSAEAKGKFCSNCGAALAGAACRSCAAPLTPGAKFCHACATPVSGAAAPMHVSVGVPGWVPWTVGGVIAVGLIAAALTLDSGPSTSGSDAPAPPAASGITDISQMSPRERANRLFDRVMRASEGGDTADVRFFAPMAVQAHEMVDSLDADLRYHLGLIHLAAGDPAAARAQGDSIVATINTHLYGFMLRALGARALNQTAAAQQADQAFLRNYDAEAALNRIEYQDHPGLIERYRDEARGRN